MDGAYDVSIDGTLLTGVTGVEVAIDAITLWSYTTEEDEVIFTGETLADVLTVNPDGSFSVNIEDVLVADGPFSVDFYYTVTINGSPAEQYAYRDINYPAGFFE